ncbi:helix-turn-helix domain-containing protein [Fictibacillus sp. KIGAM418]|uniref:Helix-turn-helix domain-containing protein n=1 Tax=Fictibacillus marinisediminis TaxID=2878389 RepID=A0A9X1XFL7_9BACL|nr:helix-turn-helix transcriptional regulator [Fictibacillus marinisediminis]MCK6258995.1 helix-turn-helix domain-containing protein [Fictibacillus marinisediminis]
MKLGEKIKYFRKTRNLSQQELAEGICSISYLSKIENGVAEPSSDIGLCLAKRLKVDLYDLTSTNRLTDFQNLFYQLIQKNKLEAEQLYQELSTRPKENTEDEILLKVFKSIYLLLAFQDTEKTIPLLKDVSYLDDGIQGEKTFYYFIAKGLLEYYLNQHDKSYHSFKKSEELIEKYNFTLLEKGYLYYLLGLSTNRLWKNPVCLDYIKLALAIFEEIYDFRRCADCRILLGIVYQRFENWNEFN